MKGASLTIDGMACDHCVATVTQALEQLGGVRVAEVNIGSARLSYDPDQVGPDRIRQAIEEGGFTVRSMKDAM